MEKVTVWKSTIKRIMDDLERASFICGNIASKSDEEASKLQGAVGSDPGIVYNLYATSNILELLDESLDRSRDYLEEVTQWSNSLHSQVSAPVAKLPPIPEGVDLDVFKDLTKTDILEALLEQATIRDAALKDYQILNSLLAMRQQDCAA